jgi:hypothetical protein
MSAVSGSVDTRDEYKSGADRQLRVERLTWAQPSLDNAVEGITDLSSEHKDKCTADWFAHSGYRIYPV